MKKRPTFRSGSGIFLISIILAGGVTSMFIETPNVVGGGAAMMFIIIILAVIFKVLIEFLLDKWQKRKDVRVEHDENHVA